MRKNKYIFCLLIVALCLTACGSGKSWKKETDIIITDEAKLSLSGNYKNLKLLYSNGNVTLDGKFPSLESIELEPEEDGKATLLNLSADSEFDSLTDLSCGIVKVKGGELSAGQFPMLESVDVRIPNKEWTEELEESIVKDLEVFYDMYQEGSLSYFNLEVTHSIEDLYGKWKDKNGLLAFTISDDGSIRVSDNSGTIGTDLLTYEELDDYTLRLQTDVDNWLDFMSIDMEYRLMGDTMTVWILGQEFEMVR